MRRTLWLALLLPLGIPIAATAQGVESGPGVILGGVPFDIVVAGGDDSSTFFEVRSASGIILGGGAIDAGGTATAANLVIGNGSELPLSVTVGSVQESVDVTFVPGWFSLLPPLIAIVLALVFREVITALFFGVWFGAMMISGWNPLSAFARVVDRYAVPALGDLESGHAAIIVFSLLIGGMVGIIGRNGGTLGIVDAVAPFASTPKRGKIATWAAGLAIFFDDYANTLIVGNTMRPVTDRLRISREKLAYIVDSTAAPVAAIVPISTWVGYEISLIGDGLEIAAEQVGANPEVAASLLAANPFLVFLHTIPYLFYPLLALAFVLMTSVSERDFGAMADAEDRAARGDGVHRPGAMLATDPSTAAMNAKDGVERRWWNAGVPVLAVVITVLAGLWTTGSASAGPGASVMDIFGAADPFVTLLWGSLAGCIVAVVLTLGQKILTLEETVEAGTAGVRAMVVAVIILILAWSLGAVTQDVGTARYLSGLLDGSLPLFLLPVLIFVTAAAIAFATGTSWGTMAILVPVVIPLTVALGGGIGFESGEGYTVLLGAISSVLAGSIFGDHCSPISDTTVLSSMASACDHVDHVRTQLPYAVAVAVVAMILGDIGTALGLPNWIALIAGVAVLWLILRVRGRRVTGGTTEGVTAATAGSA